MAAAGMVVECERVYCMRVMGEFVDGERKE